MRIGPDFSPAIQSPIAERLQPPGLRLGTRAESLRNVLLDVIPFRAIAVRQVAARKSGHHGERSAQNDEENSRKHPSCQVRQEEEQNAQI